MTVQQKLKELEKEKKLWSDFEDRFLKVMGKTPYYSMSVQIEHNIRYWASILEKNRVEQKKK